jgi:APA family basic amino acid/polyamine antiporter
VLGIVEHFNLGPLQHGAEIYVGLLAATILFLATNAGIIGVSRLTYSMGIHRQMPDVLRQLHPKFRTPWVGIIVFSIVACVAMIPGQATFLGNLYAFGAMLSFTIAHAAVVRLRLKYPDARRPYRGPMNVTWRGRDLPLFAIFGGVCTAAAWCVVTALYLNVAVAGITWLVIGVGVFVYFRRRQGLDLTTTARVAVPKPVIEHEAEYESVLVAFDEREYVPDVLTTAEKLAARRHRGIHVIVTITVPPTSPINAAMPEQELAAQSIIEQAKVQGGRRVTGHWEKVRPGQAGRRIVDEAKEIQARAIVMPLPVRTRGGSIFGRTLETVLAERPCRVIIESGRGRRREAMRETASLGAAR